MRGVIGMQRLMRVGSAKQGSAEGKQAMRGIKEYILFAKFVQSSDCPVLHLTLYLLQRQKNQRNQHYSRHANIRRSHVRCEVQAVQVYYL